MVYLDYIRFPYLTKKTPGDSVMGITNRILKVILDVPIPDNVNSSIADNYFSYDEETLRRFEKYYNNKFETRRGEFAMAKRKQPGLSTKSETNYDCVHHTIPFGSFACSVMQIYLGQNLSNDQNSNDQNSDFQKGNAEGGMLKAEGLYLPAIGSASHLLREWRHWNASNVTLLVEGYKVSD